MGGGASIGVKVAVQLASEDDLKAALRGLADSERTRIASILSSEQGTVEGEAADEHVQGSTESSSLAANDFRHQPCPLREGDYAWIPDSPIKVFRTSFGPADGDTATLMRDLNQLTLTTFLGSGAEGTVYKANYCNEQELVHCAVKFARVFPDHDPDTHEALELLTQPGHSSASYEREKKALERLRPKSQQQWQDFAGGRVRLAQYFGFHDPSAALLLEFCGGGHPDPEPALMESVHIFLKRVEELTSIEVGDVKTDNLLQDGQGITAIIDFGICQYTGGARCSICKEQVESDVDGHASAHVAEYMQKGRGKGPVSRLRLQEFCYGTVFC